jgi:hypothetical protein
VIEDTPRGTIWYVIGADRKAAAKEWWRAMRAALGKEER